MLVEPPPGSTRGTWCSTSARGAATSRSRPPLTGARVIASDLTPELLEQGAAHAREPGCRARVAGRGRRAPALRRRRVRRGRLGRRHHVRATPPGGRRRARPRGRPRRPVGLVSWTPTGFIGQMFAAMKPFVAPPPAGVQPPPLWGDEDHVRALLGDRVTDVRVERRTVRVTRFEEPADFREYFKTNYGPTIAAYKQQPDDAAAARARRRARRAGRAVRPGRGRSPGPGVGVPAGDRAPCLGTHRGDDRVSGPRSGWVRERGR